MGSRPRRRDRKARVRAASLAASSCLAGLVLLAPGARATDLPEIAGQPASVDITNTSIVNYHFDNRTATPARPSPITRLDDDYGEWLDRFNLQLSWWRLQLGLRYDVATYF